MKPSSRMVSVGRRQFLELLGGIGMVAATTTARAAQFDAERTFRPSREVFANPERGFYAQRRSDRMDRLDALRGQGISLLLVTFDLRDFREREITDEKLTELARALAVAREGGLKVLFRAAYGFTSRDYYVDPKDLARIAGHIRQIGVVLTENQDVVYGIQAGMLGPWGEWHGSNQGNPPTLEARRTVLFGWLDAVPAPITVHVRRPMFIRDIFATEPGGNELTEDTAFGGSRLSRTGWHNDAFLVRPSDMGTYAERGWNRERELAWCNRHGRFTPFGGETVHMDNPMPVDAMIRELELLHATYLNIGYHPKVLQQWRETEHQGENTFQHIARRLGYRFVAERLRYARTMRRGASSALLFELTVRNEGFASLHLPRVIEAALLPVGGGTSGARVMFTEVEPRRWGPEAGSFRIGAVFREPRDLPLGMCRLAIRFTDPAARLREDGRYAIRLANEDVRFEEAGGWNVLAEDVRVEE